MCRLLMPSLLLSLAFLGFGQTPSSEEAIWKAFQEWFEAQPLNGEPTDLIKRYREKLILNGASSPEADREMDIISRFIWTRPEGKRVFWNKVYAAEKSIFVEKPNALLLWAIKARPPGKALDWGMGQGRNSVCLALRGWDVTGFDLSEVGIRIAKANARRAGVSIHAVTAADDEFEFGNNQWDLVVVTYVRGLNTRDAERLWRALRPGGIVVYENVAASRGNGLLKAFLDFRIVRFEDVEDFPDWDPDQETRIQRLVAEKMSPGHN